MAQIAALGADEIERIAPLIKARADRILRDDWVGQAKRLLGRVARQKPQKARLSAAAARHFGALNLRAFAV